MQTSGIRSAPRVRMRRAAVSRVLRRCADRREQLVERVGELLDAIDDQLVRHSVERDAVLLQRLLHHAARLIDVLLDRVRLRRAVIAERVHRRGRHGVHRVAADQRVDVERVRIAPGSSCRSRPRAAAACARPSPPAPPSAAPRTAPCSARRRAWRWRSRLSRAARRAPPCRRPWPDRGVDPLVDQRVDAADEEARHARDARQVAAATSPASPGPRCTLRPPSRRRRCPNSSVTLMLSPSPISVRIAGMPASASRAPSPSGCGRPTSSPQPPRLASVAVGVVGEIGRALQADIAVAPLRRVVHRAAARRRLRGCRRSRGARRSPAALSSPWAWNGCRSSSVLVRTRRSPSRRSTGWR